MEQFSVSSSLQPFRFWVERGFSRTQIIARMITAAKLVGVDLQIVSTPKQPISAEILEIPYLVSGAPDIDQINKLIAEHSIDALWVQRSAEYDLSGITSCAVHTAMSPENVKLVDDKSRFNDWLGDHAARTDATEVSGVQELITEFWRRRQAGQQVCVKPVHGVNGHGYWHLTEEDSLIFSDPDRRRMPPAAYFTGLSIEDDPSSPRRLLVMEWYPGPEVSFDILCWEGEPLIHAARIKVSSDSQQIDDDHPMVIHAYAVAKLLGAHGLVSMQYRLDPRRNWKMLEVNPRPAGGSIHSEDAGFGVLTAWTQLLVGAAQPADIAQVSAKRTVVFERLARVI